MIDLLGYLGVLLGLSAMAMKDMMRLRILSLLANVMYMIYALLLDAYPIFIGCAIAVGIHVYHIRKLRKQTRKREHYL
ncbi:MAG: YgjV family protein [Flammeovirgaceae bacterium]